MLDQFDLSDSEEFEINPEDLEINIPLDEIDIIDDILKDDLEPDLSDPLEIPLDSIDLSDDETVATMPLRNHKLKYDSIFKGKKEVPIDPDKEDLHINAEVQSSKISVDGGSSYFQETHSSQDTLHYIELKEFVFDKLVNDLKLDIKPPTVPIPRRKPGKLDFNKYYSYIVQSMETNKFTYSEIFVELSSYFSDNLTSMFKILEPRWGNVIIRELSDHFGIDGKKYYTPIKVPTQTGFIDIGQINFM
jgi:hypothetical protein